MIPESRFMTCGRDLVTTGDSVDIHPSWWKLKLEGVGLICDGHDEFRKAVRDEIKLGVEIIKLYPTGGHGLALSAEVMSMTLEEMCRRRNGARAARKSAATSSPSAASWPRLQIRPHLSLRHVG